MLDAIFGISELSNEEYIQLLSTFWFRADENFNCFSCKKKMSEGIRDKRKHCFTPKSSPVAEYNGNIKYFTCPSNHFNSGMSRIIDMFRLFQEGVLPYQGGLLDQPSKIVEAFRIIENLDIERQKDLIDRKQKWQKVQSRSNLQSTNKKR